MPKRKKKSADMRRKEDKERKRNVALARLSSKLTSERTETVDSDSSASGSQSKTPSEYPHPQDTSPPGSSTSSEDNYFEFDQQEGKHIKREKESDSESEDGDPVRNKSYKSNKSDKKTSSRKTTNTIRSRSRIQCNFCNSYKHFKNKLQLKKHVAVDHCLELHAADVPPGTSSSDLKTALQKVLKRRRKCDGTRSNGCPQCAENYQRINKLKEHILIFHFKIILQQIKLNLGLEGTKTKVTRNMRVNRRSEKLSDDDVKCSFCGYFFAKQAYRYHAASEHPMEHYSELLPPKATRAHVDNAIELVVDMRRKTGILIKPEGCPICEKDFSARNGLKQHIILAHFDAVADNLQLNVGGSDGDKKDGDNDDLALVVESEGDSVRSKFMCKFCKQHIKPESKMSLNKHMAVKHCLELHAADVPPGTSLSDLDTAIEDVLERRRMCEGKFSNGCPKCGEKYQHINILKEHILLAHFKIVLEQIKLNLDLPKTKVTPNITANPRSKKTVDDVKCVYCGYFFSKKTYRCHAALSHPMEHYSELLPLEATRAHVEKAIKLVVHMRKKSGKLDKPERCPICEKDFTARYVIKNHIILKHFDAVVDNLQINTGCDEDDQKNGDDDDSASGSEDREPVSNESFESDETSDDEDPSSGKTTNNVTSGIICNLCNSKKDFKSELQLKKHVAVKHWLELYAADVPPGTSPSDLDTAIENILERRRKCKGARSNGCPKCGKNYEHIHKLKKHILFAHFKVILEQIKLNLGLAGTNKMLKLTRNMRINRRSKKATDDDVKCCFCGYFFAKKNFRTHAASEHPMEHYSSLLPPEATRNDVDKAIKLVVDMRTKSENPHKPEGCPICEKDFRALHVLQLHITLTHFDNVVDNLQQNIGTGKSDCDDNRDNDGLALVENETVRSEIICDFCEKKFKPEAELSLRKHMAVVHCLELHAAYFPPGTSPSDLDTAIEEVMKGRRKCEGKFSIGCPKCYKSFQNLQTLKEHLLFAHFKIVLEQIKLILGVSKVKVKCSFCRNFITKTNYHQHAALSHPMEHYSDLLPPEATRAHVDKAIKLVVYMRRKSGNPAKPEGCPICELNFRSRNGIKQHIILIHFDTVVDSLQLNRGCDGSDSGEDDDLAWVESESD